MQLAKTKDGFWVTANQAKQGETYYCARCHQCVRRRKTKQGYVFYHYKQPPGSANNESHEHLILKEWMFQLAQQKDMAVMEKQCGKQFADVWLAPNYVYEIQLSILSKQTIAMRHRHYQQQGMIDFWLLGRKHHKRCHYYPYLRYHPQLGYYYMSIHPYQITLHYDITNNSSGQIKHYISWPYDIPQQSTFPVLDGVPLLYDKVNRYCHQHSKTVHDWQTLCYQHKRTLYDYIPYLSLPVHVPFASFSDELYYKLLFLLGSPLPIQHAFCAYQLNHDFIVEYREQCSKFHHSTWT